LQRLSDETVCATVRNPALGLLDVARDDVGIRHADQDESRLLEFTSEVGENVRSMILAGPQRPSHPHPVFKLRFRDLSNDQSRAP
jgi:hypothetical protein